jgi:malonate transporter and related proteins
MRAVPNRNCPIQLPGATAAQHNWREILREPSQKPIHFESGTGVASAVLSDRKTRLKEIDMLDMILNSTVPMFFVMALGYFAGWSRDIDNRRVAELTALVMDFALPASLFVAMVQTSRAELLQYRSLMLVFGVSMLAIYGLAFIVQRSVFKSDTRSAAVFSLTTAFPNLASAGLPLISSVFGARQTVAVAIALAVGSILLSPLTLVFLETGGGTARDVPAFPRIARAIGNSILKPVVIAPSIGMALALCGIVMPHLLDTSLTLIGVGAGGVALFLTGLILSSQPFKLNRSVASGAVLKNAVHPLIAAALVMALAAPPLIGREVTILSAVPTGFFGILFGLRYGVVSDDVGSTLIASTILSAATIPAVIFLTLGTH